MGPEPSAKHLDLKTQTHVFFSLCLKEITLQEFLSSQLNILFTLLSEHFKHYFQVIFEAILLVLFLLLLHASPLQVFSLFFMDYLL